MKGTNKCMISPCLSLSPSFSHEQSQTSAVLHLQEAQSREEWAQREADWSQREEQWQMSQGGLEAQLQVQEASLEQLHRLLHTQKAQSQEQVESTHARTILRTLTHARIYSYAPSCACACTHRRGVWGSCVTSTLIWCVVVWWVHAYVCR